MRTSVIAWLFCFLGWSAFGWGNAHGQTTIKDFPYNLTKDASGWLSANVEWASDPLVRIADKDLDKFKLTSPQIALPELGGALVIAGKGLKIYADGSTLIATIDEYATEAPQTFLLDKNVKSIYIESTFVLGYIKSLRIDKINAQAVWIAENDEYTLTGAADAGTTAICWLPNKVTIPAGGICTLSFDIINPSPNDIQLFAVRKEENSSTYTEIELKESKGRVLIDFNGISSYQFNYQMGFKAVSKGRPTPAVKISNIIAGAAGNAIQTNATQWYDEDRDGIKEFFIDRNPLNIRDTDPGKYKIVKGLFFKERNLPEGIDCIFPYNLSNGDKTDAYGATLGSDHNYYSYKIYTNDENGDSIVSQQFDNVLIPCDYNSDGLTDFILEKGKVAVQLIDHTFEVHQLDIMTQEEYRNRDKKDGEWNQHIPSHIISQNRNDAFLSMEDMFIGGSGNFVGSMGYQACDMDFDKDGYPDLVNTSTGEILLNVATGKYVSLPLGGAIYFRDLNNDQQTDYIVYEPQSKTVTSHIFQTDGTEKTQQLIKNLSMDLQIWCYDFDKDGDVDILLPFSYLDSNGSAFLVIMENEGNGKFKMHESSFDDKMQFISCADVNNDGYYDIVATIKNDEPYNTAKCFLLKGNKNMQFQNPVLLIDQNITHVNNPYKDQYNVLVADIDNDGYYDVVTQYYENTSGTWNTKASVCSVKDLLSGVTANHAPEKPEKPSYLFEPSTGFLKISWQPGKDAESSPADLTYALRIGTQSGKGDIYYANAMEDGTRLNLLDGNMGYNLDKILNASGWKAGKYYLAIQSIDPMHKGSTWSEEVIFDKTQLSAGFFLSDERTVSDTLTLALTSHKDPALQYVWNMGGASVISKNNDESVYQIQFTTPGEKHLSLQTVNTAGEVSTTIDKTVFILGNKFVTERIPFTPEFSNPVVALDMNNDGRLELFTSNGVYENDENNGYTKIKKIFNTNLSFHYNDLNYFVDKNKDGLADVISNSYSTMKQYINQGDNTLSIEEHNIANPFSFGHLDLYTDLGHIGQTDVVTAGDVFLNAGDDMNFTKVNLGARVFMNLQADFNNDGFVDGISNLIQKDNYSGETYLLLFRNNGNKTFTEKKIFVSLPEYARINGVADMNNDGYPDLLIQKNPSTVITLLNDGEENFSEVIEIAIPETEDFNLVKVFDFDNNGYLDLMIEGDGNFPDNKHAYILYFYDNRETKVSYQDIYSVYSCTDYPVLDLNGDGVPEFNDFDGYYNDGRVRMNYTTVTNARPEAPMNVRGVQKEDYATIQWDAAKDKETPYFRVRYNVSVKRQGKTGEGAYVISPMNGLNANASSIPGYYYQTATTYSIPLSALSTGNYEVQVQAIDDWGATSAFSDPFILTIEATPKVEVPINVCAGISATIIYKGNASTSGLIWNWDGGVLLNQDNNNYEVVWNTPGNKHISVTSDGVTFNSEIMVGSAINPEFNICSQALLNSETPLTLPKGAYRYSWEYSIDGANFFTLTDNPYQPVKIVRNGQTTEAKVLFRQKGSYILRLSVYAPCGVVTSQRSVIVTDEVEKQEINLVTIDPVTGKYMISWQYTSALPSFISNINVYKEGSRYNDFHLLATIPASQTSYVDMTSNPQVTTSRYRLALQTNYGAETALGTPHQGIHIMVNKGIGSAWNIIWNQYEGTQVETYRILRGSTPENLTSIGEVSGSTTSYSDMNAPSGFVYYALDFDTKYENEWKPMRTTRTVKANDVSVRSNIISTATAGSVLFAQNIDIRAIEQNATLNPTQPNLHLIADIYPLLATFGSVNWSIISGNGIAQIDRNGILTAVGNQNGTVTVRATTIDGSNLYADFTVQASGFGGVEISQEQNASIEIYPSPVTDILYVKGMPSNTGKTIISIMDSNGRKVYVKETQDKIAEISCKSYPTGIYIICISGENEKTISKKFIKK